MAAISSTEGRVPGVARLGRHLRLTLLTSTARRLLVAFREFREGTSWEPGRDWLTRVTDPSERQEPR
jgi:hypothetical protein